MSVKDLKRKMRPEFIVQLALGLDLDDETLDMSGYVSPAEVRRRHETARAALAQKGIENPPEWFEQYHDLLNAGWPWRVAAFIAWSGCPKKNRWPKTQEELAVEVLGLTSDRAIGTWRRKNETIDDVIALMQAAPLLEYRADILKALAESAADTDHRHNPDRRLWAEMTGEWTPRVQVDLERGGHGTEDLSQYSEEELEQLDRAVRNELNRGKGTE